MVKVYVENYYGKPLHVHECLLRSHSGYLESLLDNAAAEVDEQGKLVIEPAIGFRAFGKFSGWICAKDILVLSDSSDLTSDLYDLTAIHYFSWDPEEDPSTRDKECLNACLNAIQQILIQKEKNLRNPLLGIHSVIIRKHNNHPGRARILSQLVHSECAVDGRTKTWLEQYLCYPDRDTEFLEEVSVAFAEKTSRPKVTDAQVAAPVARGIKRKKTEQDTSLIAPKRTSRGILASDSRRGNGDGTGKSRGGY
jgi:hypothetical protein